MLEEINGTAQAANPSGPPTTWGSGLNGSIASSTEDQWLEGVYEVLAAKYDAEELHAVLS